MRLDGRGGARAASAGWRTTDVIAAPRRFDLVGLVWERGSEAEAQLRARRRGGRWTPWVALHPSGDHGPDRGRVPSGTDPAFVGAADEFQLRLRGAPRALRARFVRALPTARLATRLDRRRRRRARRRPGRRPPAIIPRAAWGADSVPPREPPLYGEVQIAFVHHTVTANDYGPRTRPRSCSASPATTATPTAGTTSATTSSSTSTARCSRAARAASTRPSSARRRRATTASRPGSRASATSPRSPRRRRRWTCWRA